MKVALIHTDYRQSHFEKVLEQMRILGPPKIRAVWCEDRGFWAALEGCHRLRAASKLGIDPVIVPIDYKPGMRWKDVGMTYDYIAGAITLDEVIKNAGTEYVIGFGADRLPTRDEVPKPERGSIMIRYRIIQPINFDFGDPRGVVGGIGTEFTSEECPFDPTDYVTQGFLEVVGEPVKLTKEVRTAASKKMSK